MRVPAVAITVSGKAQFTVKNDMSLAAAQMSQLKAGGMQDNVHSTAHANKGIRTQLE